MLSKKTYLALHAWVTTAITALIDIPYSYLSTLNSTLDSFKAFIPGVSVALSYFLVSFLARFSFRSIGEIRLDNALKKQRNAVLKQLNDPNQTQKRKKELQKCLTDLDNKELEKHGIYLDACQRDYVDELADTGNT